ncbi:hypothetical protein PSTT_08853 [Puccinia striiformis]|uniref:Uncharacterized protein n=1 Tax=Puccinia striiformis TaxID=27350 RepID=A0A2S4VAQ5_9BASI|nr:hypothetical protein PSTT_08853 [Puccinia striiformis]
MSTRSKTNNPIPLTDPGVIIRQANAAKRRAAAIALKQQKQTPTQPSSPKSTNKKPLAMDSGDSTQTKQPEPGSSNQTPGPFNHPKESDMDNASFLRGLLQLQHTAISQAKEDRKVILADRQEDAARFAILEEELLCLKVQVDSADQKLKVSSSTSNKFDISKFKSSDGPNYTGPYREVEPFIKWLCGIHLFFNTRKITADETRILVVGELIKETNTLAFYANGFDILVKDSWDVFQKKLMDFALPPLWRSDPKERARQLKMNETETFLAYHTRARTLQSLINFGTITMTDFELAEAITFGLTTELRALVNNFQLLYQQPFDFTAFEQRVSLFYEGLPKRTQNRPCGASGQLTSSTQQAPPRSKDENIWRLHSYLDSMGLCRHCNKACGSPVGACPGEKNRSFVEIPSSFITHYDAGTPHSSTSRSPTNQAATVAGISDEGIAPALDQASISAMEEIDEELRLTIQEGYVPLVKPRCIIVLLTHAGENLRGLVDTGSELNLITAQAAERSNMKISPMKSPRMVNLALDNSTTSPVILQNLASASLSDPNSPTVFENVELAIGAITGDYDMILGTPFLSKFFLSISISQQAIRCVHTGYELLDYQTIPVIKETASSYVPPAIAAMTSPKNYSTESAEMTVLSEFKDLFPEDIPAISDTNEADYKILDGSFPEKMQPV